MAGECDTLIDPENVRCHVSELKKYHPDLVSFKIFNDAGHVDFTLGLNDDMIHEIISGLIFITDNNQNDIHSSFSQIKQSLTNNFDEGDYNSVVECSSSN
eukprot:TRINITY_DN10734_c0_g1_i1.p1 TRINITY_DN10734_c0_g1~~TRINITY_DN10734_c0_g1_i1.p1  ORF type:complete len:100 (-),score=21.70 TRINITY_DN10734_c0_g1_i1:57-356(-)